MDVEDIVAVLRPGARVVVGDGAGMPVTVWEPLREAARRVGGIDLLLGWCLFPPPGLDDDLAYRRVDTILGGYGLRGYLRSGRVGYLPVRLSSLPTLLRDVLRPDVAIVSLRPSREGLVFGAEVGWMAAAMEVADTVLVEERPGLPQATAEPLPEVADLRVLGASERGPSELPGAGSTADLRRLGTEAARLVPAGAAVQFGPGGVSAAVLDALTEAVEIDSGVLIDEVVGLEERGLLLGTPLATYLVGSSRLYSWADGRPILRRLEHTHDPSRLARRPLAAVNTALEIDPVAQINVEGTADEVIAGVGGHPDYAMAAARAPHGLSMVVVPATRGRRPSLVATLSAPVSTPRHDVDVVVTERGSVDLRGRTDRERRALIEGVWGVG